MELAPRGKSDRSSAVVHIALRRVRLVIGVVLVAAAIARGDLSVDLRIAVSAAAVGYLAVATLELWRERGRNAVVSLPPFVQLAADITLALGIMVLLDARSTPLTWLVLVVPVIEAAAVYSVGTGIMTWLAISVVYVAVRVTAAPADSAATDALEIALQQLAAVVLLAIPASYLMQLLTTELDRAVLDRSIAERRAHQLEDVAFSARELATGTAPSIVISRALDAVAEMGFDGADVCQWTEDGGWQVAQAIISADHHSPPTTVLVDHALRSHIPIMTGDLDDGAQQLVHSAGYVSGIAIPIVIENGENMILRAWSTQSEDEILHDVAPLSVLGRLVAAAYRNACITQELEATSKKFQHMASHDALTGLPNRASLIEFLNWRMASPRGGNVAVLFLDLDGFKEVNDSLGHEAGDEVLVAIAKRLTESMRRGDLVARLAGDEFVIVMPDVPDQNVPRALATRICNTVAEPIQTSHGMARVGASIGVALSASNVAADVLLRRADAAMYRVKRQGGSSAELFEEQPA